MSSATCHTCAQQGRPDFLAHVTVHDKRGCRHYCIEHARLRIGQSILFGHSSDCAIERRPDAPAPPAPNTARGPRVGIMR